MNMLLHPFLVCIYPILFFYSRNPEYFGHQVLYKPLVFSLLGTVFWLVLFRFVLKSWSKSALFTSFTLLVIYTSGWIVEFFRDNGFKKEPTLILTLVLLALGLFFIRRAKTQFYSLNKIITVFALCLISMVVFSIIRFESNMQAGEESSVTEVAKVNGPNIYYVILDEYARSDVLKEFFDHDNQPFLDELSKLGFKTLSNACCNYPMTLASLASSLNMEYLDDLTKHEGTDAKFVHYLNKIRNNNGLFTEFHNRGYTIATVDSGIGFSREIKLVDQTYTPINDNHLVDVLDVEFRNKLFSKTPLYYLYVYSLARELGEFNYLAIKEGLQTLQNQDLCCSDKAHFVFNHTLCPHLPFILDETGKYVGMRPPTTPKPEVDYQDYSEQDFKKYYSSQIHGLNKIVLSTIKKIQENSTQPPIIILQADHGQRYYPNEIDNRIAYPIFLSILGPKPLLDEYPDNLTPVNLFRILRNYLFDEDIPLLADRHYSIGKDDVYKFREVTL